MTIRMLGAGLLAMMIAAGCGDGDETGSGSQTEVVKTLTPREAVSELKLQLEKYRTYYYCEQTYPQVCDTLPMAYVLPREGSEPYRIVFYSNQEKASTWVSFDYVTVDAETKAIATQGQFQWFSGLGQLETRGTPLWGIPQ